MMFLAILDRLLSERKLQNEFTRCYVGGVPLLGAEYK